MQNRAMRKSLSVAQSSWFRCGAFKLCPACSDRVSGRTKSKTASTKTTLRQSIKARWLARNCAGMTMNSTGIGTTLGVCLKHCSASRSTSFMLPTTRPINVKLSSPASCCTGLLAQYATRTRTTRTGTTRTGAFSGSGIASRRSISPVAQPPRAPGTKPAATALRRPDRV